MNIGFDLDKIFINLPPCIPSEIIEWLYKEKVDHTLRYRIPSKLEQLIRIISHHPIFRSPIKKNLDYLKEQKLKRTNRFYLISSRFSFLKKRTENLIKKNNLGQIFTSMNFNYKNEQPHLFKENMIKKLKIDKFIDDDLELLKYLANNNLKTNFFWLNNKISKKLNKNLFAIKNLPELFN